MNVTRKVKANEAVAEAKASPNRALLSVWYSDVKRDDLCMVRLKLG